MNTNFHKWS